MTAWKVQIAAMGDEVSIFTGEPPSFTLGGRLGKILIELLKAGDDGIETENLAVAVYGAKSAGNRLKALRVAVSDLRTRLHPEFDVIPRAQTEGDRSAVLRLNREFVWIDYLEFLDRAALGDFSVLPLYETAFLPADETSDAERIRRRIKDAHTGLLNSLRSDQAFVDLQKKREFKDLDLGRMDPSDRGMFWALHCLTSPLDRGFEWLPAETLARPDFPLEVLARLASNTVVCLYGDKYAGRSTLAKNVGAAASVRFKMDPIWIDTTQSQDLRSQLGLRLDGKSVDSPADIQTSLEAEPDRCYLIILGMETEPGESDLELISDILESQAQNLGGFVVTGPDMNLRIPPRLPRGRRLETIEVNLLDADQAVEFFAVLYEARTSIRPDAKLLASLRELFREGGENGPGDDSRLSRSPIMVERFAKSVSTPPPAEIDRHQIKKFNARRALDDLDKDLLVWLADLRIFAQPFSKGDALAMYRSVQDGDWDEVEPFLKDQPGNREDLFEVLGYVDETIESRLGGIRREAWIRLAQILVDEYGSRPAESHAGSDPVSTVVVPPGRRPEMPEIRPEVIEVMASDQVDTKSKLALVECATELWRRSGSQSTGIETLSGLLAEVIDPDRVESFSRADSALIRVELAGLLNQRSEPGDLTRAEGLLAEATGAEGAEESSRTFARASVLLADISYWNDEYDKAWDYLERARPTDPVQRHRIRCKLGWISLATSRFGDALGRFEEALRIGEEDLDLAADPIVEADCRQGIGICLLRMGDIERARLNFERGKELVGPISSNPYAPRYEWGLIELARMDGDLDEAFEILDESLPVVQMRRLGYLRARFLQWHVRLLLRRGQEGDLEKARLSASESAELLRKRRREGSNLVSPPNEYLAGRIEEIAGNLEGAVRHFTVSSDAARSVGQSWNQARSSTALARVNFILGRDDQALTALDDARLAHEKIGVICPDVLASTLTVAQEYPKHLDSGGELFERMDRNLKLLRRARSLEDLVDVSLTEVLTLIDEVSETDAERANRKISVSARQLVDPDERVRVDIEHVGAARSDNRLEIATESLADVMDDWDSDGWEDPVMSARVVGMGLVPGIWGEREPEDLTPIPIEKLFVDPTEIEVVRYWSNRVVVLFTRETGLRELNRHSETLGTRALDMNGLGGVGIRRLYSLQLDPLKDAVGISGENRPIAAFALFALNQRAPVE